MGLVAAAAGNGHMCTPPALLGIGAIESGTLYTQLAELKVMHVPSESLSSVLCSCSHHVLSTGAGLQGEGGRAVD